MDKNVLVHIIADYGDDNAFGRVKQKIREKLLDAKIPFSHSSFSETWVPAFDTRATGFNLAEIARSSELAQKGVRHIFYVNTAPRKDDTKGRQNNDGEKLIYVKLTNGVEILGVNSGDSFAFLDGAIAEARHLDIASDGSQFRSLHVFPDAIRRLLIDDKTLFKGDASADIPSQPEDHSINLIEGYGNIKTNIQANTFDENLFGKKAVLEINGLKRDVKVSRRLFEDAEGTGLVMYVGSSGWENNGKKVYFMEFALRGASAANSLYNESTKKALSNGLDFTLTF